MMSAHPVANPSPRLVFRNPGFRCYMGSRFLTTIATEMQAVAVGWQVYGLTHRPLDLGLVGLAQFLPGILLFLFAGQAADRWPRQRILQICYAGFSLCSLALLTFTLRGVSTAWPIYLALIGNGTVRSFNGPASQAFLPLLVEPEHFPTAVAWGLSVFQAATILGPTTGGLAYAWSGSPLWVYAGAAVSYLAALAMLSAIRVRAPQRPRQAASLGLVLEGFRYVWRNKLILGATTLDLFAVLLGGAIALLPVYAREILHAGATGLGILRSAPALGAVTMAIAVAHWPIRRKAGPTLLACVFAFGLFTILFGVSRSLPLSIAALALAGASDTVSVVLRHTLIQLGTPDEMRGRVSAVNGVFIGASNELGQFESGLTAQWFGAVPAVILGGLGTMVVVAAWAGLFPELRRADALHGKHSA
jgi:MFS family permease